MNAEYTRCNHCGTINNTQNFWCKHCNKKLDHNYNNSLDILHKGDNDILFKIATTDPKPKKKPRSVAKGIVIGILITMVSLSLIIILFNSSSVSFLNPCLNPINCQINEDFWFNDTFLYTADGWTFEITKIKDYTLEGIVLGLKTYAKHDYPYRPINTFSPIDLFIGIDDVQDHPQNYPHQITSFSDRCIHWIWEGDDWMNYQYFKGHTGNNHIIPQSPQVLSILQNNITIYSHIIIQGSLVNLYGQKESQYYTWTTDTQIGNYNCEIILVENITFL